MPGWGEILRELQELEDAGGKKGSNGKGEHIDHMRRQYMKQMSEHTGRDLVLYATNWTRRDLDVPSDALTMSSGDIQGFMEALRKNKGKKLDLIIHSPGGSAEAAEVIAKYARTIYEDVRAIIPQSATSSATMLACSADAIMMGPQSSLGPIDPQITVPAEGGTVSVSADAIVDQLRLAEDVIKEDPDALQTWFALLAQYYPGLVAECFDAQTLAEELVSTWLAKYMFADRSDAAEKSRKIAEFLSDRYNFRTHGRFLGRDYARSLGLRIERMEDDPELQDLILSVFNATIITFDTTPAVKIIESHTGDAYILSR